MRSVGRSSTQARLLALLTSTPGQEFHTRELVRRVDGTERPVHLALERLEREGLIASRRSANLRLWRMDPAHPLYAPLRQIYTRTVGVAAKLAEALRAQPGVELAFLYGSYVNAQDDASSDIDLFVLGETSWEGMARVTKGVSEQLGREVKEFTWSNAELEKRVKSGASFLDELRETEKIWLIGSDDEFERRVRDLEGEAQGGRPGRAAEPQERTRKAERRRPQHGPSAQDPRRRRRSGGRRG